VKTVKTILVVVLLVNVLVMLGCGVVAFMVGEPPALGAMSAGTMLLATGLLCLGEAVSKSGPIVRWRGTDVKDSRLSSFAFGVGACAMGVVFLGHGWLPERYGLWAAVVFLASLALALLGSRIKARASRDGRRNTPAPPATGAG